jgi:A/G-specific adenine glycosylase
MNTLWRHAESHTPLRRVADYTQAIMDLGATVCVRRNPLCDRCPLRDLCRAYAHGTQMQFPQSRTRKSLPERSTRFLIALAADGSALLYRRPPSGIWGGLWSFPELDVHEDIAGWCRANGLRPLGNVVERSPLKHTFTHFKLAITPLEIAVERGHAVMDSDRWLWYNVNEPAHVGLAKPVLELLSTRST